MQENIIKLSEILNEGYNEKTVVALVADFFDKNFNAKGFRVILKENYDGNLPHFPLYKHKKIIGYIEFTNTNIRLEKFLKIALYMLSLKFQNIELTERMQKAVDFQNAMKNIAKILETQYELNYIIPLLGEMIDKFIQNHLIYIFIKTGNKYKLMWPSACNENKIFDIINLEPRKRITTNEFGIFPIITENKLLGYVVTKNIDTKLSLKETESLEELTNQSALTINRANAYAEILKHATLDALTGFYNRRQLDERIKQEIASAKRQKTPLCAIMVDIDFFKSVNDKYGHATGDIVLKTVSKSMRSQLREYDIAGRYGGEEFAILLPFTRADEAVMVAERLRKAVEKKVIDISKTNSDSAENEIHVTISLGIYEFKQSDTEEDLLQNADKALYRAKAEGRNRVVIYE